LQPILIMNNTALLKNQAISMLTAYLAWAIIPALLFPFGISIGLTTLLASVLCWLVLSTALIGLNRQLLISSFISIALFFTGAWSSMLVYDMGFDAMWYHQPAVFHLKEGWNPVFETISEEAEPTCSRNLNHLPKAAWIAAAQIYWIFENIEASKLLTGWLLITSFFWVAYALNKRKNNSSIISYSIAILVACNPICINQLASSYVDGQLGGLYLCLIAISWLLYVQFSRKLFWLLLISFIVFANIKFTATAITGLSFLISFIYLIITQSTQRRFIFLSYAGATIILTIWAGYSPFVKNTITKHDPLYPVFEKDFFEHDKIYPLEFEGSNRFSRFYLSVMAKPAYPSKGTHIEERKLFRDSAVSPFGDSSPLVGSFGPFSAEIIFITVILFFLASILQFKQSIPFWVVIAYLFITIFINSEAWLGRYSPQFWIILCLMLLFVAQNRYLKFSLWIVGAAICINGFVIGKTHLQSYAAETKRLFYYVNQIPANQHAVIDPGWTSGYRHRIKKLGIPEKQQQWLSQEDTATQIIDKDLKAGFKLFYDFNTLQH